MPRTLDTVFGAASGAQGVLEGMDIEENRQRSREIYRSQRGQRERADEKANLEHGRYKRDFAEDEGARDASLSVVDDATAAGSPRMLGAVEGAPAGQPGGPEAPAGGEQPADNRALWLRQAEAQRQYWTKKGRADKASKVMTDAINSAIAEQEAKFKFDVLPKMEDLRRRGIDIETLQTDQKFAGLREQQVELDARNAGLMWGHVLAGNKKAAIDSFNASGITSPGVKIADVGQSSDGQTIYLLDEQGQVAKDKSGRPLKYPRQLLDNMWQKATTNVTTVKKNEAMVQTRTGPSGQTTVKEIYRNDDPAEARAASDSRYGADKKWADVLGAARDDASKYLKDTLGLTPNALGQVLNPENNPIFEIALPIAEQELQKFRSGGKRLDQVTATDVAKRALAQARDEYKRGKAGAGPTGDTPNPNPNAPAGNGPTWRDVLN